MPNMNPFRQFVAMLDEKHLLARFWHSASRFWRTEKAISLLVFLVVIVLLQLLVQVLLNIWNREFFDALGHRDARTLWLEALYFVPLAAVSILLAATSVWARMTTQRSWREAMTRHVLDIWLAKNRFRRLNELIKGAENPEYRISYDVRIATDAPIDMTLSFFSSILTSITFFGILWTVGGSIEISLLGVSTTIPGYLVFGVIFYSGGVSFLMHLFGRHLAGVSERVNQAEAEFRSTVDAFHEGNHDLEIVPDSPERRQTLQLKLQTVLLWWREYCWQLVRTTLISHANFLFAPVVAWLLCAPKYLSGEMSLGELTQSAAAFVVVQSAFNWLVDNYTRLADWQSSASRVATLLLALDELEAKETTESASVQVQ
jgi:vitamin B12/bleomycin/antimicrobial peptide transport system ATP-binding/permease protein